MKPGLWMVAMATSFSGACEAGPMRIDTQAPAIERVAQEHPVRTRVEVGADVLAYYAGSYALETTAPLMMVIEADDGRLLATIAGQFEDLAFFPESETRFFASAQPFELVLSEDACSLTLVTSGAETRGVRVVE